MKRPKLACDYSRFGPGSCTRNQPKWLVVFLESGETKRSCGLHLSHVIDAFPSSVIVRRLREEES